MDNEHDHLTVKVVEAMARSAGLHVDPERAERLRTELVASHRVAASLDAAIEQAGEAMAGAEAFDAGWDRPGRGGGA